MLIAKDDATYVVTTLKEGLRLLQKWNILDPQGPMYEDSPHSHSSTCGECDDEVG